MWVKTTLFKSWKYEILRKNMFLQDQNLADWMIQAWSQNKGVSNSFLLEASTNCSSKSVGPVVRRRSVLVVITYPTCIYSLDDFSTWCQADIYGHLYCCDNIYGSLSGQRVWRVLEIIDCMIPGRFNAKKMYKANDKLV